MFIAALSRVAKLWKQPKCPPTDKWIKKVRCVCVLFIHKKEWNLVICDDTDGAGMHSAKRNESVRERQIPYDATPMLK